MVKRILTMAVVLLIGSVSALADGPLVAAAISLKDAMTKLGEQYKTDTGKAVSFTYGSSGQLAAQITNGAPVDLFISAANKQVNDLEQAGLLDNASRKVVAGNALVLVVPGDSKLKIDSLKSLLDNGVTKIAIGEPKSVPAGQYATQSLTHEKLLESLKGKFVYGTNVRQVLDFVTRGEVSAALVYATDAKVAGDKLKTMLVVDNASHEPIVYPAAVVKGARQSADAKAFLDYMLSDKGQAVLKEMGFTSPGVEKNTGDKGAGDKAPAK